MTIPTKTLAVRLFEYGGPDKLIYGEDDLSPLGERDVLVKNFAGSVSRWDVKYRAGDLARYQLPGRARFRCRSNWAARPRAKWSPSARR